MQYNYTINGKAVFERYGASFYDEDKYKEIFLLCDAEGHKSWEDLDSLSRDQYDYYERITAKCITFVNYHTESLEISTMREYVRIYQEMEDLFSKMEQDGIFHDGRKIEAANQELQQRYNKNKEEVDKWLIDSPFKTDSETIMFNVLCGKVVNCGFPIISESYEGYCIELDDWIVCSFNKEYVINYFCSWYSDMVEAEWTQESIEQLLVRNEAFDQDCYPQAMLKLLVDYNIDVYLEEDSEIYYEDLTEEEKQELGLIDKEEPEMENNSIKKMVVDTYKLCAKENKSAADEQAITEIFTNSIDKLSEVKLQLNEALSLIDKKDKELAEKDKQLKLIAAELKRVREQFASEKVPSEKVPEKKSPAKTRECSPDEFRAALRKTLDIVDPKKFTVHRFKDGKEELVLKQAAEDEHIQQFFLLLKKNNINRSTLISNKGYLSKEIAAKFVKFMQLKKYWK